MTDLLPLFSSFSPVRLIALTFACALNVLTFNFSQLTKPQRTHTHATTTTTTTYLNVRTHTKTLSAAAAAATVNYRRLNQGLIDLNDLIYIYTTFFSSTNPSN